MFTLLAALANRITSKLAPCAKENNEKSQDVLLYHSDGSISLNLENKKVQERIAKQLEELEKVKINTPAPQRQEEAISEGR